MDQSNPSGSPNSMGTQSIAGNKSSPPSNLLSEGEHDAIAQENNSASDQVRSSTPPAPLLRPAQGAWDRAYGKPPAQARTVQTLNKNNPPQVIGTPHPPASDAQGSISSPAAHTRSKDNAGKRREPSAAAVQDRSSRVTHPESAQRHSQASGLVTGQPPTQAYNPPQEPRDHYRGALHGRPTPNPSGLRGQSPATVPTAPGPQYPSPDQPPLPSSGRASQHEHSRPSALQSSAPSGYSPSDASYGHPAPANHYSQNRPVYPEIDQYAPALALTRNQTSTYQATNYTQDTLVCLLMEDLRPPRPEPDFQLAEVSVSLRPGEEGLWWADGEEVMRGLQSTTSRLSGAAKIFALRGKYRHCFARLHGDGTMECQPSSLLMVSANKDIKLVIEHNPEGRMLSRDTYSTSMPQQESYPHSNYASPVVGPSQPRGPYEDYGHYTYPVQYYPSQNSNAKRSAGEAPANLTGEDHPAKRQKTDQASSSSKRPSQSRQAVPSQSRPGTAGVGAIPGPSTLGLGSFAQVTPTTRMSSPEEGNILDPISPYGPFQRHEALPATVKPPKEVVNAAIVAYLRSHIQNEDGYIEFAASKGRLLPIPDLLKGYRFATRIVNTWANRKTPPTVEGCPNKRITKNHVLQALFRQTSWGSDCEQTLQLADRYGPGGPREDPRVVDILTGGSMLPEKSGDKAQGRSQGSVALLDFLKDVDKEHKAKQEDELRKSVSSGGKDPNESGKGEGESVGDYKD